MVNFNSPSLQRHIILHSKVATGLHTIDQVVLQDDVILSAQNSTFFAKDFKHLDLLIEIAQVIQTHLAERVLNIQSSRFIEIRVQDPNARARDLQWQ